MHLSPLCSMGFKVVKFHFLRQPEVAVNLVVPVSESSLIELILGVLTPISITWSFIYNFCHRCNFYILHFSSILSQL